MKRSEMTMSREDWAALDAFVWATIARKHWRELPAKARLAVMRAAAAKLKASETYVAADDAVRDALGVPKEEW